MNKEEIERFAREAAKGIKTEQDLSEFSQMLTKVVIETALNAELDEHLGYERHDQPHSASAQWLLQQDPAYRKW